MQEWQTDRLAREIADKAGNGRLAKVGEADDKTDANRLTKEAADKAETDRLAKETAGKAETDRLAKETADKQGRGRQTGERDD